MPKLTKTIPVAVLASVVALAASVSLARAQTGGATTTPTTTTAPAPGSTSWTVYKKATWYGPGFWGRTTACGVVLEPTVIGTAHKGLPCGTQVTFNHAGRTVYATVIDRGPYRKGYAWDLTKKAAKRVGLLRKGSAKLSATVTPPAG